MRLKLRTCKIANRTWIAWTLWRSRPCEENTGGRVNWSTVL